MKIEINKSQFRDLFNKIRPDNFSYTGLGVLYDYLDDVEGFELDVIGVCCDYTESSITEALEQFSLETIEQLEDNTTVLRVDDETIIYQDY